ncbi:uncharacterized protein KQ657_000429 [Scheffersomyces spartinae]|uniref:Protein kinase domain-containing protein n=1 Tax=Scheffersomyces spartinae TaxID=45513 RepID=A0A9P8AID2_9ASCO|nr:uncharacterized protein KQ657_000429 [Scheffersomyces spartinae]KAG7193738.1 hypothetical protein KQ657_000429 [Scheffersomyces spartinae]
MFRSVFKTGIRSDYNVLENATFHSEPWLVYPAKHRTNGKLASVFIFDKTKFESGVQRMIGGSSYSNGSKSPRLIINECYDLVRKEIGQLAKLKHPQLLTVLEVLEETKTKFLFATEPVTNNLVSLSDKHMDVLTIQKGLLQLSKGIQFLHNFCNIVHMNLQPSSIFINNLGDWKLGGFTFIQNLNEISFLDRENFYIMNNSSLVPFANLNVNYTAPELILDSNSKLDMANDIWSLGCLVYYIYNGGESLINCFETNSISDFKHEFHRFEKKFYNHRASELKYVLKNVPETLFPIMVNLLARYPHDRITIDQFIDSDYFNGSLIKAMLFIDEFATKSSEERLVFLKGLLQEDESLLGQFPASFKQGKLLPLLIDLIVNELHILPAKLGTFADKDLELQVNLSLSIIFKIGSELSSLGFQDRIYEVLLVDDKKKKTNLFTKLLNSSVKIRLTIVDNLSTLDTKLNDKQLMELISQSLELFLVNAPSDPSYQQDQIVLQESFLQKLPLFVSKMDFPYIKNTLVPTIAQVFKFTTVLSTKLATITSFEMLVNERIIDKPIVIEQIIPIMANLKSRDKRVVLNVLSFYMKLIESEHISLDLDKLVESILPHCYNLAFGCNDCTRSEFEAFMGSISKIQNTLVERKLTTLPTDSSAAGGNSINQLISQQKISAGNKELSIKGPLSKSIMQPRKISRELNELARPQRSPIASNNRAPVEPIVLQPKRNNNRGTNNKAQPLTFGAISQASNTSNSRVVNQINTPVLQPSSKLPVTGDDEDFEDFQQASGINWDAAKVNNTINSSIPVMKPMSPTPASTPTTNYPPGFNSVLTPMSVSSTPKPSITKSNGVSASELLDLI